MNLIQGSNFGLYAFLALAFQNWLAEGEEKSHV